MPSEQETTSPEVIAGVDCRAEKGPGRLVRRAGREDDGRRALVEKLSEPRRDLLLVGLVVEREARQSQCRWPVRLWRPEPLREQADDAAWRVHPVAHHPGHRRQAQFVPESVQVRRDQRVDQHAIDCPPEAPLRPSRRTGDMEAWSNGRLNMIRSKDRRRQVHGGGRDVVLLLEDAREEADGMADEYRTSGLVHVVDALVAELERRCDLSQDDPQSAARVPKIRIFRNPVELFHRMGRVKAQAGPADERLKGLAGDDDHFVAAGAERPAEADEGMDVAGRADGRHDEASGCHGECVWCEIWNPARSQAAALGPPAASFFTMLMAPPSPNWLRDVSTSPRK